MSMSLPQAIQIIGRFTDTAVLSPGKSYFADDSLTFIGSLDTDIEKEVGLYKEIANFARILNLFDDPAISIEGTKIRLEDADSKAYFLSSDISLIRRADFDNAAEVEKTLNALSVVELDFDEALISKIKAASASIDNSSLILKSQGGKVYSIIKDVDILASDSHSMTIEVTSKVTKNEMEFCIELDPSICARMPRGGFKIKVAYSTRVGSFRVIFNQGSLNVITSPNILEN